MSIQNLVDQIKQSTDYQKNKQLLREQMHNDLLFTHNQGLFKATPELIAFLSAWDQPKLFIEDQYSNPVECDRLVLLEQCKERHQRVINRWHVLHEQLQSVRKI
jgi:4'-phosphopantetheinyl transferase EntD